MENFIRGYTQTKTHAICVVELFPSSVSCCISLLMRILNTKKKEMIEIFAVLNDIHLLNLMTTDKKVVQKHTSRSPLIFVLF